MNLFTIGIVVAVAFVLQIVFSMAQMKYFSREFVELRRGGRVVCGRKSGGFYAGAVAMFQIDADGMITAAKKIEGVTVLARVKSMPGFIGKHIANLTGEEIDKSHKNLRKAVRDASLTYRKYIAGETITEPLSPLQQAGIYARTFFKSKKA